MCYVIHGIVVLKLNLKLFKRALLGSGDLMYVFIMSCCFIMVPPPCSCLSGPLRYWVINTQTSLQLFIQRRVPTSLSSPELKKALGSQTHRFIVYGKKL